MTKYQPASPDGPDVFAVHRIDEQLTKALDRKVWLPSGGTLVIDRTEAMTVVDVNTGKFTGSGGNLEQTVTRNNLEAAEETVRQLRLRDIGGIIVIDFIDMVLEANRDLVLRRLTEALGRDRTRHQVSEVTSLGLVQLTRKKLGTGLIEAFSTTCPHCAGRGIVLHGDPVDSGAAPARKSESAGGTGRRGKRGKKGGKPEDVDVQVAKVPSHAAGEHPMFKAMAAANGRPEDDDAEDETTEDETTVVDEGRVIDTAGHVEADDEDTDDDLDDEDSDEEDSDDDLEADDEDEDIDDDIEVIDSDDDSDDDEDSDDDLDDDDEDVDEDEDDDDEDDDEDDDDDDDESLVASTSRPRRRRAAARPAGPPAS